MEIIAKAWSWFVAHWAELVQAVLCIIGGLEVIAKWTETDKDDKAISLVKVWVNKINKIVIEIISYITKFKGTK